MARSGVYRRRDQRGQVLPLVAICMVFVIIGAAFGVDLGSLMAQKRKLQSIADLVALDSARSLNGTACNAVFPDLQAAALASAVRNNYEVSATNVLSVKPGIWDTATKTFTEFGVNDCGAMGAGVPNAVEVVAEGTTRYGFARVVGIDSQNTSRHAVALRDDDPPATGITVGSYLAAINSEDSPLLNQLFGNLISGTVLGYDGLAAADVTLGDLAASLGLGSGAAALSAPITFNQFFQHLCVLTADDNGGLDCTANVSPSPTTITLGQILGVEAGHEDAALGATMNALDLFGGAATLIGEATVANGQNFLAINGLEVEAAGLLSAGLQLTGIQAAQSAFGPVGTTARNAQVEAELTLNLLPLLGRAVTATVDLTVAEAIGTVADINCVPPNPAPQTVTVGVDQEALGLTAQLTILGIPVNVPIGANSFSPESLVFDGEWGPDQTQSTSTTNLMITAGPPSAGGILNLVVKAVAALAAPVLETVLNTVLAPLLEALGVRVPGADVTNFAIDCPEGGGLTLVE